MLQSIREKATGLVAWVIAILIIVPFALWGIQEYLGGGKVQPAAKVLGEDISQAEFESFYQLYREREVRRLRAAMGGALSGAAFNSLLDEKRMRAEALDSLISNKVMLYTALDEGYAISDTQLAARINSIPVFQVDGRFDQQAYEAQLRAQGMTPVGFERRLRGDLLVEQAFQGVLQSEPVTGYQVDLALKLGKQERELGYVVVPFDSFEAQFELTESDVQRYYEAHSDRFISPEQVTIEYVELKADEIAAGIAVSDEELRQYYDAHADEYTEVVNEEALQTAQDILGRIRSGESFEELAREYSQDPGSKDAGGDLGYFGRNAMVKPFDDAVFSMQEGEVSEPVRSEFGYHIIKLTDIRDEERRASHILIPIDTSKTRRLTFQEARERVERDFARQTAEERFLDRLDTLANLAYEVPDTLEDAANAVEAEVRTSGWFTRQGGDGIASHPKVVETAFRDDLIAERTNSDPVEITPEHVVVLRVKEHKPATPQPFAEVREVAEAQLRAEKAQARAQETGQSILEQLNAGQAPAGVAEAAGLEWVAPRAVRRRESGVDPNILRAAFAAKRPAGETPVYEGLRLPGGDYAVLGVFAVRDGDPGAAAEEERKTVARQLQRSYGEQSLEGLVMLTRSNADVVVYDEGQE